MSALRVVGIIQARMGSTRLPGKVMMDLEGKPVLEQVVTRVKQATTLHEVLVATTHNTEDDILESFCLANGILCYRGSAEDVLDRYYQVAKQIGADVIVRLTADCPLIDPRIVDEMVNLFLENHYDLVTNAGSIPEKRTFPRGLDAEVFSIHVLEKAWKNGHQPYHREHVTPYIYEESHAVFHYLNPEDLSEFRLTLDTPEDYELISRLYKRLYTGSHHFYLSDIMTELRLHPEYKEINNHIEQKKLTE